MFPQIQFDDFKHQQEYMPLILRSLSAMVVNVEGGQERLLQTLVDRAVYKSFQLLRGPFACKLKNQDILHASRFEPEEYFSNNPLTSFAGYVEKDYALRLPSISEILQSNKELLESRYGEDSSWAKDNNREDLFAEHFQQRHHEDFLDLTGRTELERYEVLLQYLGHDRADDWSSWFYVTGVTCTLLRRYDHSDEAMERIWQAHCRWSQQSFKFDEQENWLRVTEADRADRLPGLRGLTRLVQHDHPLLKVRDKLWPFHMPKQSQGSVRHAASL